MARQLFTCKLKFYFYLLVIVVVFPWRDYFSKAKLISVQQKAEQSLGENCISPESCLPLLESGAVYLSTFAGEWSTIVSAGLCKSLNRRYNSGVDISGPTKSLIKSPRYSKLNVSRE